jgi:hypothetical protein
MVAALLGGLLSLASTLAGRVLLSLGFGFVSYSGITASMSWLSNLIQSHLTALPSAILQIVGVLQIDVAIAILTSAVSARLVLRGMQNGVIKRLIAS